MKSNNDNLLSDLEALELCEQLQQHYYSLSDDFNSSFSADSANSSWSVSEDDDENRRVRGNRIDGKQSLSDIARLEIKNFRAENDDCDYVSDTESPDTPSMTQEES